jgi:peptide/nickel transport system permease protein
LLVVTIALFLLTQLQSPRAIALASLPPGGRNEISVQGYIRAHHLGAPLLSRLATFFGSLLRGNLGTSSSAQVSVSSVVLPAFWRTVSLVVPAFLITVMIAVRLGAYLAEHAGTRLERVITPVLALADAIPSFVSGVAVLFLFAVKLHWFGVATQVTLSYGSLVDQAKAYALPVLSLVILQVPYCAKLARQAMADVLSQPYARSAVLRGLTPRTVRWRCLVPNCASVLAHSYGLAAATMVAGALIVENVFSFPGLGRLSVSAISSGDQPTLIGIVLITSIWLVIVSICSDALAVVLSPKLKGSNSR